MADENAKIDDNYKKTLIGVTDDASAERRRLLVDNATGRLLVSATIASGAITSLNGLSAATQTFATGTTGTDFAISSATSTHTFNLPDASATARGAVTTGNQTLAGIKTFSSFPITPSSAPTTDYQVANKKYVDDSISPENLWDRATTVLSPHNAGDSVRDVTDFNGLVVTANTGAITTGTWNGTVIAANYGGTGVANNAASTITITGNYALGLTLSAATSLTLPTTGTVATTSSKLSDFAATTSAELAGVISDETGSGSLVFATSPSLTTPTLGVATATTINKVTITAPASASTLTIADGKTLSVSDSTTLANASITLGNSKVLTLSDSTTLDNASITLGNTKVLTLSDSTTLNTDSITFAGTEVLTLTATKNVTFADAFATSGAFSLTLTTTAATDVTLPTTGTLATLAGTEELDNKTLDASVGKGTWTASGTWTLPAITLGGTVTLGEVSILLDAALSGDEKWSGIAIPGTLGDTIVSGDLCYLNADDSRWELVDANLSDGYDKQLGICLAGGNDGDSSTFLTYGKVRSAAFPAFTVGSVLYMSETAGDVTHTQPSTASVCIRIVGIAITAEDMLFNPSPDYITHA